MKYACNKCLKVAEDFQTSKWLKITVHRAPTDGGNKEILLCSDCKPGFWRAVDCDLDGGNRRGKG